jgi:Rieske Fe-S protein
MTLDTALADTLPAEALLADPELQRAPRPAADRRGRAVVSRRTALGAACVGCAALVTACGSSDDSSSDDSGSAGATSAPSGGSSAGPAAGGASLVALADLKVGQAKSVTSGGKKLVVTRTGESTAVAFSAICTHQGCTVEPKGEQFACPCHGSVFKNSDGSVVNGPATRSLPAVAVTVAGGNVVLA